MKLTSSLIRGATTDTRPASSRDRGTTHRKIRSVGADHDRMLRIDASTAPAAVDHESPTPACPRIPAIRTTAKQMLAYEALARHRRRAHSSRGFARLRGHVMLPLIAQRRVLLMLVSVSAMRLRKRRHAMIARAPRTPLDRRDEAFAIEGSGFGKCRAVVKDGRFHRMSNGCTVAHPSSRGTRKPRF